MEVLVMTAPSNNFFFDLDVITQAGKNWRRRRKERERLRDLLQQRRFAEVEPKRRLAKRANRLLAQVREAVPAGLDAVPRGLRELVSRRHIAESEINNSLFERVIGETRDFLSVGFFERGLQANKSVGRIVTRQGGSPSFGTGFLVSPRLVMTNWHVLRNEERAASSTIEFDYQLDRSGVPLVVQRYKLKPDSLFMNDKELDFALVAVEEESETGKRLGDFGWCPLLREEGKITKGDPINIIQHPRGNLKQVVLRENRLVDLLENMAHYEGDTEPGSSGSPVFNDQWEVVALHHSGVPRMNEAGAILDIDGNPWKRGDDPTRVAWVANEGIRVSRLVAHIASAKVREHEEPLRREMLEQSQDGEMGQAGRAPKEGREMIIASLRRDEPRAATDPAGGDGLKALTAKTSIDLQAGSITVTVPLTITISIGSPVTSRDTKG
jgi:endonuclease G